MIGRRRSAWEEEEEEDPHEWKEIGVRGSAFQPYFGAEKWFRHACSHVQQVSRVL